MATENSNAVAMLARLNQALLAVNTHKGYLADWKIFLRWCELRGLDPLPAAPDTIALYIASRVEDPVKVSTITRHVYAIRHMHRKADLPSPINPKVLEVLRGARRYKIDQTRQMKPLEVGQLRAISAVLLKKDTVLAARDRAILLLGFASALRSASLVALTLEDLEETPKGLILKIRREKQDQEGKGRLVGIPHGQHPETCAVKAVKDWIARRGSFPGPLFIPLNGADVCRPLQPERVCQIVQRCLRLAGFSSAEFGSHSLRAAHITVAGEQGASELLLAAQSGHRDLAMLRRYFRRTDLFKSNSAAFLGL